MAILALVTLPLSGHMRPMMAAARALQQVGHRPIVIGPTDLIARVPKEIETRKVGIADMPPTYLDALCSCLTRMRSLKDMTQMLDTVAALSQFYIDHLPCAVEATGASAILHDQLEPGAGIVARGLSSTVGIQHISLACALPMNREPAVPPPFMGWRYRPGPFGAWLNGGYYNVVNWILAKQSRALEAGARRFGLSKPDGLLDWQRPWSVDDGLSRTTDLSQGLANLDYPRENPPIYLGPFREEISEFPGLDAIAHERDGRELAFISLGTLMGGRCRILAAMTRAAMARGLQPVVVHGGRLQDAQSSLPRGTISRDFLDQREILSGASAAIIHGGYNSTTDAIAAGVPVVTVPLAFEQSAIAARAKRSGLGRTVGPNGPGLSQRISLALGDVMTDPAIKRAARRARFEALAAPGLPGLIAAVDAAMDGAAGACTGSNPAKSGTLVRRGATPVLTGQPAE